MYLCLFVFVCTYRRYATLYAIGTIGAVIMPNVLFLHSTLVLTRKIDRSSSTQLAKATRYNLLENGLGMLTAFVGNMCIVCAFAAGFFDSDCASQGLALVNGA